MQVLNAFFLQNKIIICIYAMVVYQYIPLCCIILVAWLCFDFFYALDFVIIKQYDDFVQSYALSEGCARGASVLRRIYAKAYQLILSMII